MNSCGKILIMRYYVYIKDFYQNIKRCGHLTICAHSIALVTVQKYRPCCSLLGQCWPQKTCYKGNWSRIIIWILRYLLTDTCIMPNVLNCDNQGRIDWTNHLIHRAHAIPVWGYHRIRKSACTEISSGSRFKVQYNYVLELSLLYCQERWMWNTLEEWHKWIYNDGIVTWNILEG